MIQASSGKGGCMDSLTFISEMVKALVWPVVAIIALLLLRKPLKQLIPLLDKFKYKDLELDFNQEVRAITADVNKQLPGPRGKSAWASRLPDHWVQMADLAPRAVVLEAWLKMEASAVAAIERRKVKLTSKEKRAPLALQAALGEAGILDEGQTRLFSRLRNLRNACVHAAGMQIEPHAALEYASSALRLAEFLEKAK
jgi:hypothetical protein